MDLGTNMTDTKTATIIDALTNKVIERNMTEDELANEATVLAESKAIDDEAQAKSEARTSALAKLAALGLTEEEIAAL
jgi:hypothetical protein